MIDIHCHVLPNIDDGARELSVSIAMAKDALAQGVSHLVCTPHIMQGHYNNSISSIFEHHEKFKDALIQANCPLKTAFAAEVRISPEILQQKRNGTLPYLGKLDGRSVLLLELPHSHIPAGTDKLLSWLKREGVQPLIPHPERNRDILTKPTRAMKLIEQGALLQVTAGAFCHDFGQKVYDTAVWLLESDMITVVASDAHNMHKRPIKMQQAYKVVSKLGGPNKAELLFRTQPWAIVSGLFHD